MLRITLRDGVHVGPRNRIPSGKEKSSAVPQKKKTQSNTSGIPSLYWSPNFWRDQILPSILTYDGGPKMGKCAFFDQNKDKDIDLCATYLDSEHEVFNVDDSSAIPQKNIINKT